MNRTVDVEHGVRRTRRNGIPRGTMDKVHPLSNQLGRSLILRLIVIVLIAMAAMWSNPALSGEASDELDNLVLKLMDKNPKRSNGRCV